jgi:DNA polymerase-4
MNDGLVRSVNERTIVHVDMDAFFASVEQLDDPSLRGRPVLVGGAGHRSVVAAASYEARPFGVRSAMPMAEARRRCPEAIIVPGRHRRYAEVSESVFAIFQRYTPLVEGLSLDEAFLDVTGSRALHGDGETIARAIKRSIREELSLTASAGVAPCKFVAKIASDIRKPDGLCVVTRAEVESFLAPLPIERMWGIGAKTAEVAHSHGFHTLASLAASDEATLIQVFGTHGPVMAALARGEDDRDVNPSREAKSIGAEDTFDQDLRSIDEIARSLLSQSMHVAARLYDERLAARVVTVKIKHADFTLVTRRVTLTEPTYDTDAIHRAARKLLDRIDLSRARVRLTGVSVSDFVPIDNARTLFPDPDDEKRKAVERIRATLRDRFGNDSLTRASLVGPSKSRRLRDE